MLDAKCQPVQTVLRIRPFLPGEQEAANDVKCVRRVDQSSMEIFNTRSTNECFLYQFDHCLDECGTQDDVFDVCRPLVDQVVDGGRNATVKSHTTRALITKVFAYGITGAGKTYTMDGTTEKPGLIPRAVRHLFGKVIKAQRGRTSLSPNVTHQVLFSHVEIYNEKVYDLMQSGGQRVDLQIRQDAQNNINIADLTELPVDSYEQFERFYNRTRQNRSTAATGLNLTSSRSHSILKITVLAENREMNQRWTGKLHLIDLAGSEDNRKTGNNKDRMVESGSINKSLFMLSQVVDALNNGASSIPYRNSKLTRLLQDSLGGKALALMITNIAPGLRFYCDTMNSLTLARRTRKVVNRSIVNQAAAQNARAQFFQRQNLSAESACRQDVTSLPRSLTSADKASAHQSQNLKMQLNRGCATGQTHGDTLPKLTTACAQMPPKQPAEINVYAQCHAHEMSRRKPLIPNLSNTSAPHEQALASRIAQLEQRVAVAENRSLDKIWAASTPNTKRGLAKAMARSSLAQPETKESGKEAAAQKVTSAMEINTTENLLPPAQNKKSLLPTHFNLSRLNLNFEKDKQGQVAEDENAKPLQNAIRSESSAGAEGVGKRSQLTMKPGKLKLHKKVGGTTVPIPGSERPLDATPTDSKLFKARPGNELADQTSPLGLTLKEMEKQSDQDLLEILNGSDLKKITSVRGIGVTRAQRILEYRAENGPFDGLDNLHQLGISDKVLQNIRKDFFLKSIPLT